MSQMSELDQQLQVIRSIMGEPSTPEQLARHNLAQRLHGILSDLDDITAMAAKPETIEMVNEERILLGRINTRVQLILSFLLARQPLTLQLIRGRS